MIDLQAIFRNRTPDHAKLKGFGFVEADEGLQKEYPILDGTFTVVICLSSAGNVDFRVYDCESEEEYLLAHVYDASGAFVGKIHMACENILREISEKCFFSEVFRGEQTKRILKRIEETCGAKPEYRGKGYGKALLKKLASIAVERGCGRLEWSCLDWNKPSIDFYLSLGAVPMSDWTVYRVTGDTLRKLAD